MKKFSITKLEIARKNPSTFAKTLMDSSATNSFGGYPKSMRWLNAACKFHDGKDLSSAINSIETAFSGRKDTTKNRNEVSDFIGALSDYTLEFAKRKLSFVKSREPINIKLSNKVRISGQIPLIHMRSTKAFSAY